MISPPPSGRPFPMHNDDAIDLTAVKRTGLSEQVARQLLGLIRSGNLKPGDGLPAERELARQLGVSRPVVREALRALSTFGLIHTQHGGGSTITAVQPESLIGPLSLCLAMSGHDLPHIFEARAAIEAAVLRNVARCIQPDTIDALRDNLRRQRAVVKDATTFNTVTDEFRRLIIDDCDNPFLVALAKSLEIVARQARMIYLHTTPNLREHLERHDRLVDALAAGDAEAAVAEILEHLRALQQEQTQAG